MGVQTSTWHDGNQYGVPQITGTQSTSSSSYATLVYIPKGFPFISQRHMFNSIHRHFIVSIQKLEITKMFFICRMDKENTLHLDDGADSMSAV